MNLNKDNETTSYLIRKIPKKVWNKFNHLKIYTLCETKEGTHATCIKKEKK